MTDPLSPEEIAEKRQRAELAEAVTLPIDQFRRLLDIAEDHARLCEKLEQRTMVHKAVLEDYIRKAESLHDCIDERDALRAEVERERNRLAACGVAALGYFDGCADEYRSASLEDVLKLKVDHDAARARIAKLEEVARSIRIYTTEHGTPRDAIETTKRVIAALAALDEGDGT